MTAKEIYGEFVRRGREWTAAFMDLAKLYKEANSEHRQIIIDMLKRRKG